MRTKANIPHLSTIGDGGKKSPEPLFLLLVEKNPNLSLKVFSQFNSQISYQGCLFLYSKKVSLYHFSIAVWHHTHREASQSVGREFLGTSAVLLCQILLTSALSLVSGFWHLSLFHALLKWLLLLEVSTIYMIRDSLLCPTQLWYEPTLVLVRIQLLSPNQDLSPAPAWGYWHRIWWEAIRT